MTTTSAEATNQSTDEPEPYPVLDETGKVKEWLENGRELIVWRSVEIGSRRADLLTPGDADKPHWAYERFLWFREIGEVLFFQKSRVVKTYTDTPAGWKAAERNLPDDYERAGLAIKSRVTHSVQRLCYETTERVPFPLRAEFRKEGAEIKDRALDVNFRIGIVEWVATIATDSTGTGTYSERASALFPDTQRAWGESRLKESPDEDEERERDIANALGYDPETYTGLDKKSPETLENANVPFYSQPSEEQE